ncbi:hypothetical protein K1719_010647 [Acacia pycnantha]|nr:hypothetical protein K1719_010647 [Acacia pycnantha]
MESGQDRGGKQKQPWSKERDVLLTFHAHLHLSVGRYWTENVWEDMARYYEGLAGSPATPAFLKLAWAKYSLEHNLITSLRDFGIHFNPVLNMLVGCDSCWDAAEVEMPDHKELIQNMKRRVIYNFYMLEDVFSYFSKDNASSSNDHEQRITNLEKEMEEMKVGSPD